MNKTIKLIWDFRGPDAARTAKHFQIHLQEALSATPETELGWSELNSNHSIAFLIVSESEMIPMRDRFKPHRGEYITT
ncbi:MAG: hypothetical protein RLZZ241_790 [Bacteroidota bacterium]|jgi:hypothetical protein